MSSSMLRCTSRAKSFWEGTTGERRCRSIEELKAWSQNLGHDGVLTTLTSYGQIPIARQAELISRVGGVDDGSRDPAELLQKIEKLVSRASSSASS